MNVLLDYASSIGLLSLRLQTACTGRQAVTPDLQLQREHAQMRALRVDGGVAWVGLFLRAFSSS